LIFVTSNIDEGSDWYLGAAGVIFSASRIANGEFGLFVRSDFSGATINPITTTGASFYLCVNTGTGFSATGPNREIFGWAELKSDGSTLSLSSSAVSYTMPGIIIGTTTAVPEPASAGLFFSIASVFVALASKRRRKCPQ
jgi:hypothetical protein